MPVVFLFPEGCFYFQDVCVVFTIGYFLFQEVEGYNENMEIEIKNSHNYTNFFKGFVSGILMGNSYVILWLQQSKIKRMLHSFSVPKTPRQVEKELGIKKINMKPFLEKKLLKLLNPSANKGRLYVLTNNTNQYLGLSEFKKICTTDWCLIGWILASPRQRHVVIKAMDSVKRTSENIRERASRYNSNLTRISTKEILKELINKGLIETKMSGRKRYYWVSEKGRVLVNDIENYY